MPAACVQEISASKWGTDGGESLSSIKLTPFPVEHLSQMPLTSLHMSLASFTSLH